MKMSAICIECRRQQASHCFFITWRSSAAVSFSRGHYRGLKNSTARKRLNRGVSCLLNNVEFVMCYDPLPAYPLQLSIRTTADSLCGTYVQEKKTCRKIWLLGSALDVPITGQDRFMPTLVLATVNFKTGLLSLCNTRCNIWWGGRGRLGGLKLSQKWKPTYG